jgi:hypothetical protein
MSGANPGGNRQLIAAAVLVLVALSAWLIVRRHDAGVLNQTDPSACWTATCRDAVVQGNRDRTTGLDLSKPAPPRERQ